MLERIFGPGWRELFNPYHDRRGRFAAKGGGATGAAGQASGGFIEKDEPTMLTRRLAEEGGFTYQPVANETPRDGYMVSPYKDREHVVDQKSLTARALRRYIVQNADLLTKPDHYLGGWVDAGKVYLDISVRKTDRAAADQLAREHGQLAYYDLGKGETTYVQ